MTKNLKMTSHRTLELVAVYENLRFHARVSPESFDANPKFYADSLENLCADLRSGYRAPIAHYFERLASDARAGRYPDFDSLPRASDVAWILDARFAAEEAI